MSSAEVRSEPPVDRNPSSAVLQIAPSAEIITPEMAAKARRYRVMANLLSIGRAIGGVYLAYKVAHKEQPAQRWGLAAGAGILAVTDCVDGALARRGRAIDGKKSPFGAWADQMSDKVFINGLMAGLTYAHYTQGRRAKGGLLGVSTAVTMVRDAIVTADRIQAERADVGVDTAAKRSGKIKMAIQAVATVAAVSPLTKNTVVDRATTTALVGSTIPAVTSGIEYHNAFNAAIEAAEQPSLAAVPPVAILRGPVHE